MTARRWLLALYGAAVVVVTLQKGLHHPGNFLLFRGAFQRLVGGENLYATTPDYSGYLYSPTFAVLFAPFALPPPLFGLLLWNAANAFTLAGAVARLLPPRAAAVALGVAFLDVVRSLQNSQSNALMAGLIGAYFTLWLRWRSGGGSSGWRVRTTRQGGVAGALVSTLGLSTGPCTVTGCGAPVMPVIGLAFAGLSSSTITWMSELSMLAVWVVLGILAVGVVYLGWRTGAPAERSVTVP